jgi:hypothetical protein
MYHTPFLCLAAYYIGTTGPPHEPNFLRENSQAPENKYTSFDILIAVVCHDNDRAR